MKPELGWSRQVERWRWLNRTRTCQLLRCLLGLQSQNEPKDSILGPTARRNRNKHFYCVLGGSGDRYRRIWTYCLKILWSNQMKAHKDRWDQALEFTQKTGVCNTSLNVTGIQVVFEDSWRGHIKSRKDQGCNPRELKVGQMKLWERRECS